MNDPFYSQVYDFGSGAVRGDLGTNPISGVPVASDVRRALPHTIVLTLCALSLALVVGALLGIAAAAKPNLPFDALIEEIDIGGPSMVRAAAKNFHDVLVVVDPADYDRVAGALEARSADEALRFDLARKALGHTAAYDTTIAATLGEVRHNGKEFVREKSEAEMLKQEREVVGILSDVAPTILGLMGVAQPKEMTGKNLTHYL